MLRRKDHKMDSCRIEELKAIARNVRLGILEETYNAGSGHPGGSLSCTDILTYLYFEEMKVRPEEPKWVDRDRFVLSKGHAAPALYAVLAEKGFFPKEQLKTLRKIDSMLQAPGYEQDARSGYFHRFLRHRAIQCLRHGAGRQVGSERPACLHDHR